jgi:hypothetical protein
MRAHSKRRSGGPLNDGCQKNPNSLDTTPTKSAMSTVQAVLQERERRQNTPQGMLEEDLDPGHSNSSGNQIDQEKGGDCHIGNHEQVD